MKELFQFRTGHITASCFKASVHTNPKAKAYSETVTFTSKVTKWGCEHKKTAREVYTESIADNHTDLTVSDSDLVIHPDSPHIGASLDGVVNCSCCGAGVIAVKCPFLCSDKSYDSKFCLKSVGGGDYELKSDHSYYYQVQLQMKLCDVGFCDFVVWKEDELIVLHINQDEEFIRNATEKPLL